MKQPGTEHWLKKKKKRGKKSLLQSKYVNTRFQSECYLKPDDSIVTWQLKSLFHSTVPLQYGFVSFLRAMELANLIFYICICV